MNSILIKNVLLDNAACDILIEGNSITRIEDNISTDNACIIDGSNKAALPALYNMHTHIAMNIMRGYADDMALMPWLQNKIWPLEANLTEDDIYWGSKFACLEMIKAGTVLANDMYWHWPAEAKAAGEMGIRLINGITLIDLQDDTKLPQLQRQVEDLMHIKNNYGDLVQFSLAPHAVYTVSEKTLVWTAEYARKHDLKLHIHISETEQEVRDCQAKHGLSPLQYLDKIGFLDTNVIAAHMVWLDSIDFEIVKKTGITIAHCPVSNMKLGSGIFKYDEYARQGIPICVATDGSSSNNNLDLFEEMKFAALLAKISNSNPEIATADEIFRTTTYNPAQYLNMNAGIVKCGNLADIILVDLDNINLIPNHNLISNLIYSAHADCVHTTICNGKILMDNHRVDGENEIITQFQKTINRLMK